MNLESITRRVKAVRTLFGKNHIDALILTKPANVTYLTGFAGDDSWAVVGRGAVYLLTDSRYIEQAQKECPQATPRRTQRPDRRGGRQTRGKAEIRTHDRGGEVHFSRTV